MDTDKPVLGRPTKLTPENVELARLYVSGGYREEGDVIPTHAGIAAAIKVHRATLYAWAKDKENIFYDILEECNVAQERRLLNGGLSGDFNANITKLALGKQGYSEKTATELTGADGNPIELDQNWQVEFINAPGE